MTHDLLQTFCASEGVPADRVIAYHSMQSEDETIDMVLQRLLSSRPNAASGAEEDEYIFLSNVPSPDYTLQPFKLVLHSPEHKLLILRTPLKASQQGPGRDLYEELSWQLRCIVPELECLDYGHLSIELTNRESKSGDAAYFMRAYLGNAYVRTTFPFLVGETASSLSRRDVTARAKKWLLNTKGETKRVLVTTVERSHQELHLVLLKRTEDEEDEEGGVEIEQTMSVVRGDDAGWDVMGNEMTIQPADLFPGNLRTQNQDAQVRVTPPLAMRMYAEAFSASCECSAAQVLSAQRAKQ